MSKTDISAVTLNAAVPRIGEMQHVVRVLFSRWVVVGGMVVILALVIMAIFAPFIAPYSPNEQNMQAVYELPSNRHLLGTDEIGRDVLSRLIYGSRISLLVGVVTIAIGCTIGAALGLAAGYFGGWTNIIIMRFIDALLALPPLVLILAITAVLGGGLTNVLIGVGIGMMPTYCRLMCGQVLSIKESDYILAERSIGSRAMRLMFRHLLPNSISPVLVLITMNLGTAIMMEASLSFLGIGIIPPTATWGSMVAGGYKVLLSNPVISFAPGICILLVVLAFNMVGDGLRDALDPRLRGTL
jgi:peptide/nickel transport system permease protein